ncbi:MAG: hypothetical protein AVDCRST_MAG18-4671, partial [uncultured Thermomicrobiales bacterium]
EGVSRGTDKVAFRPHTTRVSEK